MLANASELAHLDTRLIEPLRMLETQFTKQQQAISEWFQKQWALTPPPVYGSVDLRNAGFKIAPIDMNLFPAGFNNLNPNFLSGAIQAAKNSIKDHANITRLLIIPESHTRNRFYFDNIHTLQKIYLKAGFEVRFGSLAEELQQPLTVELSSGETILIEPIKRKEDQLFVDGFCPEFILLNNDLSEGIPEILQNLKQPILPPLELGWSQRLKSKHFQAYAEVTNEFGQAFGIDPWLLAPLFRYCKQVDFMQQEGLDCVINHTDVLFTQIKQKYAEYNIPNDPFIIVKADAGTYGMAVMTVRDPSDLKTLNRKQRTRMASTKGNQPVRRVIIQEGVYTFETVGEDRAVAEPVVYLLGRSVIGGFYRVHKNRGVDENLNSPGMQFEPIDFPPVFEPGEGNNRFYLYGVIAQLSMLAAAREMKDQAQK